jgi:cell division control protein 42
VSAPSTCPLQSSSQQGTTSFSI